MMATGMRASLPSSLAWGYQMRNYAQPKHLYQTLYGRVK